MPRALVLAFVVGCTLNGPPPKHVTAPPAPDEDRMPSSVLDRQDPGADTSQNPVLTRSEAHYRNPNDLPWRWLSCAGCSTDPRGDGSVALVLLAVFAVTRRRDTRQLTDRATSRADRAGRSA